MRSTRCVAKLHRTTPLRTCAHSHANVFPFQRHAASPVTMPTLRLRSAQKLVPIMPTKMTFTGSHTRTTPQLKGSTCRPGEGIRCLAA